MVSKFDSRGYFPCFKESVVLSEARFSTDPKFTREVVRAVKRKMTELNLINGDIIPSIDSTLYSPITRDDAQIKIATFYQHHFQPKEGEKRHQVTPMQRAYLQAGFTALETLALNAHDLPEYLTFLNDTYGALNQTQECVYSNNITPRSQLNFAIAQQLSAPGNQTGLDLTLYIRFQK